MRRPRPAPFGAVTGHVSHFSVITGGQPVQQKPFMDFQVGIGNPDPLETQGLAPGFDAGRQGGQIDGRRRRDGHSFNPALPREQGAFIGRLNGLRNGIGITSF